MFFNNLISPRSCKIWGNPRINHKKYVQQFHDRYCWKSRIYTLRLMRDLGQNDDAVVKSLKFIEKVIFWHDGHPCKQGQPLLTKNLHKDLARGLIFFWKIYFILLSQSARFRKTIWSTFSNRPLLGRTLLPSATVARVHFVTKCSTSEIRLVARTV